MTKTGSIPDNKNTNIFAHACRHELFVPCTYSALSRAFSIKYPGVIIENTLGFCLYVDALSGRVRKLTYIFKCLRHVSNPNTIELLYLALCQLLLMNCVSVVGGASASILFPLEKTQLLIIKASHFLPRLFPTSELYKICKVLSVQQLFILYVILLMTIMMITLKIAF